jgi:hypothetical protein
MDKFSQLHVSTFVLIAPLLFGCGYNRVINTRLEPANVWGSDGKGIVTPTASRLDSGVPSIKDQFSLAAILAYQDQAVEKERKNSTTRNSGDAIGAADRQTSTGQSIIIESKKNQGGLKLADMAKPGEKKTDDAITGTVITENIVLKNYISKGVALSDQQCDEWLTNLSHENTKLSLDTGFFNIVSNTITSTLGLISVGSGASAAVGIGSAAVNSAGQQYRTSILFTVDFAELHSKITAFRVKARAGMLAHNYKDFDEATRELITYDKICSRDAVQLLLQQSLRKAELTVPGAIGTKSAGS